MVFKPENIPNELRALDQWVCWRLEDDKRVPINPHTGRYASPVDHTHWGSFDLAVKMWAKYPKKAHGVSFILTPNDDYAVIDLDDTHGDSEAFEKQKRIFQLIKGYAEYSPSGKGLHIVTKATFETGRRRSYVEMYCRDKAITFTGNVFRNQPILEQQKIVRQLWLQLGPGDSLYNLNTEDGEETETDGEIFEKAKNAKNGEKFLDLWNGDWEKYDVNGNKQSAADFMLIDILAFYSNSKTQIKRMFLASALGKREKATKHKNYINYMLNKCFDRKLPTLNLDVLKLQIDKLLDSENFSKVEAASSIDTKSNFSIFEQMLDSKFKTPTPPGLISKLANFLYAQSPRPVKAISLCGAISLMSGICGRTYNVEKAGLNTYLLLLALSGSGKDAVAKGIDTLIGDVSKSIPAAAEFIGPGAFKSDSALAKYMANGPKSFLSIFGEFGKVMSAMTGKNSNSVTENLIKIYLDLYMHCGQGRTFKPFVFSDKLNNTSAIENPAFSFFAETAPQSFFSQLNENMLDGGFFPRFLIIENEEERGEHNEESKNVKPSAALLTELSMLCSHSLQLNAQNKVIDVLFEDLEVHSFLKSFGAFCDERYRQAAKSDCWALTALWARGHLSALKLAALAAVGVNSLQPKINIACANWAVYMVLRSMGTTLRHFELGDFARAGDEGAQERALKKAIFEFLTLPWERVKGYIQDDDLYGAHENKIIPFVYLQRRLTAVSVFNKDRMGATFAIRRAIRQLEEAGDLAKISAADAIKKSGRNMVLYAVTSKTLLKSKF